MARQKGTLSLASNIEPSMNAPLDGRSVVNTILDLTASGSFPYFYEGMIVSCKENHKVYQLTGNDPTVSANWEEIGTGGGGGGDDIQVEQLPEASATEEGHIYQYIGETTGDLINGYFYKCINNSGTYEWITVNIQPDSVTINAILLAANWDNNNQQELVFSGYNTSMSGTIGIPTTATKAQKEAASESLITVASQNGDTFVIEVKNVPSIDIPVCLICGGGGVGSVEMSPTYSTTPKRVGTWYNGAAVYEVVITGTTESATYIYAATNFDTEHGVKELVSLDGYVYDSANQEFLSLNYASNIKSSGALYFRKSYVDTDGKFWTGGNTDLAKPFKAIIRYVRDH